MSEWEDFSGVFLGATWSVAVLCVLIEPMRGVFVYFRIIVVLFSYQNDTKTMSFPIISSKEQNILAACLKKSCSNPLIFIRIVKGEINRGRAI